MYGFTTVFPWFEATLTWSPSRCTWFSACRQPPFTRCWRSCTMLGPRVQQTTV